MKKTIKVERLSSITLLKIMLITSLFPWVLIDTVVILFHLFSGDFIVNYTQGESENAVPQQVSLAKFVLVSYPIIVALGAFFTAMLWLPCAFSLWVWSKISKMDISYYEAPDKET
ncbi:hypothetical protein [Alcanivorax sp.]|uniref:hypothetical protein n=1 Tax=Alcanivorax sp. TaxID=1872427 RepID=UPI000C5BFEF5|nr:hypothetical protein [Alcanivorax sp.]MBQ24185.1 hypothetical protein [Alcanivorax sp.]|tara:strand:+ start:1081 stop:1425 length:345 start_codon:yes stop_codon:yes gene_type:complete